MSRPVHCSHFLIIRRTCALHVHVCFSSRGLFQHAHHLALSGTAFEASPAANRPHLMSEQSESAVSHFPTSTMLPLIPLTAKSCRYVEIAGAVIRG
jgi:hypothetical protein